MDVDYYECNAKPFFDATVGVDMTPLYQRFLPLLPSQARILDAGCGSGRDLRAFARLGYRMTAFDASPTLSALAEAYAGQHVYRARFQDIAWQESFEGVWACGSLLHISTEELPGVLRRLASALVPAGVLYASFKYGHGEREHHGRRFTDMDEDTLYPFLAPEFPFLDIDGNARSIDFALRAGDCKVAFEVDGPTHYQPPDFDRTKYEDDLLRQNSLIHQGWQVYRWTDHELDRHPERVKEQLALFLDRVPGLLDLDDFLPKQKGAAIDLRAHQRDALEWLARIRAEGRTIALLEHATGSGKTVTAIEDAKRVGGPVLYVAHRKTLVHQAGREFARCWSDVDHGRIEGGRWQPERHVVCASVQALGSRLADIPPDRFRYLIIDEAHHAAAESYRRLLGYFTPVFTLGLTATPERPDGKPVLELFRDAAHRLSLKDAIERGELVPIRCVRVKTNVDLSRVRFNEVQYNRRDLETTITVPSRNALIVDTYLEHVPGRKGVTFCVNVLHGKAIADLFRERGVPARSVSGAMPAPEREAVLAAFARGELHMLCACDLLNEGWDCPDVEVLLMARPTLSKIIYMQQLGRGTRKAPGKESLLVFDFVDNAGRYNQSWNLHRLTRTRTYRPRSLCAGPAEQNRGRECQRTE